MKSVWNTIADLKIHARVWEREDLSNAPAVVLVPGLGMSSRYTVPTAALLAENWRVYAPDMPGFGHSDKPPRTLDVPELAQFLAAWIEAMQLRGALLIGNSFGCQIIAQLAVSAPEILSRATAVVMIAPTIEPGARQAWRQLWRLAQTALVEPLSLIPLATVDYFRADPRRVWRTFRFALRDRIEEKLPRITTPTLVISGGRDPLVPQSWAAQASEILPRGRLVIISHAAHAMYFNSPREVARIVEEFAARTDAARVTKPEADAELPFYGT